MHPGLFIFDFDGVVADSEFVANVVVAAYASELGFPVTPEEALPLFVGKRSSEVRGLVERGTGRVFPDFETTLLTRTLDAFAKELTPVAGVAAFIDRHAATPRCIASSSSHRRLEASLKKIELADRFSGRVFSADDVERGKPSPDLFLHAARTMGVSPLETLVVEDSPAGIVAAEAAGMVAIGLLAGSHVRRGLADRLHEAGADHIVQSYVELDRFLEELPAMAVAGPKSSLRVRE